MQTERPITHIILLALAITIAIFGVGILLNYGLDFVRINTIVDQISTQELQGLAYAVEEDFTSTIGGNACQILNERVLALKSQIRIVGADLATYSSLSQFKKKDFDYLKRKYILLQLKFFTIMQTLNKECDDIFIPVLFFYKIDDDVSERQGFILEDLSKAFEDTVIVLSFDREYKDEPLIDILASHYNVSGTPTVIIGGTKREGLVYEGELNASVMKIIRRPDPYAAVDFTYVLQSAGINATEYARELESQLDNVQDPFAAGDIRLILGRLSDNRTQVCNALPDYDRANSSSLEVQALLFETSASMGCGRNRRAFLHEAASRWREAGVEWRADILEDIAALRKPQLHIEPVTVSPDISVSPDLHDTADAVWLGKSILTVLPNARVLTQADRVTRDWLGGQISQSPYGEIILSTFSERRTYSHYDLMPEVGWHEGGRLRQLISNVGVRPVIASCTMVAELDGRWYAPDENGIFRFEVPLDKVSYPTTRFLKRNLAVIMDTHGTNMLVEQAVRHKASIVLSDCDHPGKVAAAQYLSKKDISVICLPDKYAYLALGNNISLLPSPPITFAEGRAVVGNRPVELRKHAKVVVANATDYPYALWYYQTPAEYFFALGGAFPLDIHYVLLDGYNQTARVTDTARELSASVIGVRIFSRNDYDSVKDWLDEDSERVAVLFHSASYPYGFLLFEQYPAQTSFGDVNPVFK